MHLEEMLDAASRITFYLEGWSPEMFEADLRTMDAVCMNLIRIGEGANRLSEEVRRQAGDIPWRKVIALRHFLAHSYAQVRTDVLWTVAFREVPPIERQLRSLARG